MKKGPHEAGPEVSKSNICSAICSAPSANPQDTTLKPTTDAELLPVEDYVILGPRTDPPPRRSPSKNSNWHLLGDVVATVMADVALRMDANAGRRRPLLSTALQLPMKGKNHGKTE